MTDTVKVLSDDEVAEIATRPWAYPYLHNTEQRVLLRVAERDALCATVRALRADVERLRGQIKQMERDAREDARDAAAEAHWQERQGEDYGSY